MSRYSWRTRMRISSWSAPRVVPVLKTLVGSFLLKGTLRTSSCGFPFFGLSSGTYRVHTFLSGASSTLLDEDPAFIRALICFVEAKNIFPMEALRGSSIQSFLPLPPSSFVILEAVEGDAPRKISSVVSPIRCPDPVQKASHF
ncbi:hypothetical protein LIER_30560 [Lithospermum erythrorhizon]|uniref:Uncharacterized protein n=1 Tax=Lithospermum erythrorhizon TaxID=34254 RepID=A0AAV3RNM1_LITER